MTPTLHPSEDLWLDFAAGQLPPPPRMLLEAHLAYCPSCRDHARALAEPGARLLEGMEPGTAPAGLLQGILARLKPPPVPMADGKALPLPRALWPLLPDLSHAKWQGALTRGFRFLQLPQGPGPGLFLIHMEAGRPFPRHGHTGLERSLVLAGGLRDEAGVMEAGDYEEAPEGHVHTPVALPDEDCWLLASLEGGIRFTGWRGLLQRVAGQ